MNYLLRAVLLSLAANSLAAETETFSHNNVKFATSLYQAVLGSVDHNFVVSPFSIQTAGAMLYSGAGGNMAEKLAQSLKLSGNNVETVASDFQSEIQAHKKDQIQMANKIYIATGLEAKPKFHQILKENYGTSEESINFQEPEKAVGAINSWVKDVTHGKIEEIVQSHSLDQSTLVMILNAIYFKGDWRSPFTFTYKSKFFNLWHEEKEIDFMNALDSFRLGDRDDIEAKILEMPYKDSDLSMMLILPNREDGFHNLQRKIGSIDFLEISIGLRERYAEVTIPKFKIDNSIELRDTLTKMGLGEIFSNSADFSNMIQGVPVQVGKAIHKTFIDVNENGTEAAAVTGISVRPMSLHEHFIVNRPFIFAIKSKTAVLFLGRFVG